MSAALMANVSQNSKLHFMAFVECTRWVSRIALISYALASARRVRSGVRNIAAMMETILAGFTVAAMPVHFVSGRSCIRRSRRLSC